MSRQRADRTRPTLIQYMELRLGRRPPAQLKNFVVRPLGAESFAAFWRYWNPLYGYFLLFYVYRPVSRYMPRPVATLATFAVCGFFLHDLPSWALTRSVHVPGATFLFLFYGAVALLGEALHMDLSRFPWLLRALVNVAYIAGGFVVLTHVLQAVGG